MNVHTDRLNTSVRQRWEHIDWATPLPPTALVIPEDHYAVDLTGLDRSQRVRLNRLLACFTCELFIHFEAYVTTYLTRSSHRVPMLSGALIERFVAEERVHSEMFQRLLHRLRPDLYPEATATSAGPTHFLRWGPGDDAALQLAPTGTFFLLAWLFEEITLFVPQALDAAPASCSSLVADVMRLHAREEQPHVAIDARVLTHLSANQPRWWLGAQTALTLPLLAYVDGKIQRAWGRLVALADDELRLTSAQRRRLRSRSPSQSDRWGMASFSEKLSDSDVAGAPLLCWTLRQLTRADAP